MSYQTCIRCVSVAFVATMSLAWSQLASAQVQGMTFDMVSNNSMSGMAGMPSMNMLMHTTIDGGGDYRSDIIEGPDVGLYRKGDYLLMTGGHTFIVHPASKTYNDMMEAMTAMLKTMPSLAAMDSASSHMTAKLDTVAAHDSVSGLPATHLRVTSSMTRVMMGHNVATRSVFDYWFVRLPMAMNVPSVRRRCLK